MQTLHGQKSTYSGDGSNCIYVAATPAGSIHLRESDEPDVILTTTPPRLRALIRSLKDHPKLRRG
jgi:hypothetical protein